MAITFLQSNSAVVTSATPTCAFTTQNATLGSAIIVCVGVPFGSTVNNVTPNAADFYNIYVGDNDSVNLHNANIFVGQNSISGSKPTITVNLAASAVTGIVIYEFAGVSFVHDGIAAGGGTGTTPGSSAITTANANDLIVSFVSSANTITAFTAGYTGLACGAVGGAEYKILSSTSTETPTYTQVSGTWVGVMIALKAAVAPVFSVNPRLTFP